MKKLSFILFTLLSLNAFSQDITGTWYGVIDVQGLQLNLVFNIAKSESIFTATMDSPDQGVKGVPMLASFENPNLKLNITAAQIEYNGALNASNEIIGFFTQAGTPFPMNLSREKKRLKKPQEPTPPFSYYSEEVKFKNHKDNITLAGTLTLPNKDSQFPVVVLISGSGPQNRDSEILGHKTFLVIADYLTRKGIGVLRFDDRGVAESEGDRAVATSKDFAEDVRAAVGYLKTRKDINPKKIGLIGHSEGGIIAPLVAAGSKDISFIVLLAGTGMPGDALLLEQSYLVGKSMGLSETVLEEAKKLNEQIYSLVKNEKNTAEAKKQITEILITEFGKSPEAKNMTPEQQQAAVAGEVANISSPWFHYFLTYDPAVSLKNVKCPVLVLNGEKDIQVSSKTNTTAIKNTLEKSGNKKVTVIEYPNLNHLFQQCTTCTIGEYGTLEETFSPLVLQQISDWIGIQVK